MLVWLNAALQAPPIDVKWQWKPLKFKEKHYRVEDEVQQNLGRSSMGKTWFDIEMSIQDYEGHETNLSVKEESQVWVPVSVIVLNGPSLEYNARVHSWKLMSDPYGIIYGQRLEVVGVLCTFKAPVSDKAGSIKWCELPI
jgi:hypothetical protein